MQSEFNWENNGGGWKAVECVWSIFVAHCGAKS